MQPLQISNNSKSNNTTNNKITNNNNNNCEIGFEISDKAQVDELNTSPSFSQSVTIFKFIRVMIHLDYEIEAKTNFNPYFDYVQRTQYRLPIVISNPSIKNFHVKRVMHLNVLQCLITHQKIQ